jgi:hypothetical protein
VFFCIVAYRHVAWRRRDIRKHVPAETRRTQCNYNGNGVVFYVVRAEELKRRKLGQSSSASVIGRESVISSHQYWVRSSNTWLQMIRQRGVIFSVGISNGVIVVRGSGLYCSHESCV